MAIKRTSPAKPGLAEAVDHANESFFFGRRVSVTRRREWIRAIAAAWEAPGAYAGTFGEAPAAQKASARCFTGESLGRSASRRHVLAQEACRVLRLTEGDLVSAGRILQAADERLSAQMMSVRETHPDAPRGFYCCPMCTVATWRHALEGGLSAIDANAHIEAGAALLKTRREADGGWKGFPFFYTLSALVEMPREIAGPELRHAAKRCRAELEKLSVAPPYKARRLELLQRALSAKCRKEG